MPGAGAAIRMEAPGAARYNHRGPPMSDRDTTRWPRVSDYAVEPESGQELFDGQVREAAPAGPLHSRQHSQVDYVLRAYTARGYGVDTDLLTRQAVEHNFASDTCVRRDGIDPGTGDRYLEELAFEIKSTQRTGELTVRARAMSRRGVRRIFAIPVRGDPAGRNLVAGPLQEWLPEAETWRVYDDGEVIEDPCLYEPLPVRGLLDAVEADDVVAQALIDKRNRVVVQYGDTRERRGRREGELDTARAHIHRLLSKRGVDIDEAARSRIAGCEDPAVLQRWFDRAVEVTSASQLFDDD